MSADAAAPAPAKSFLGHPRGLAYLMFAEAWERFSYYGMLSLLVLYMGQQLLLPGHVEHVAGFAAFRAALERLYGPLSPAALASAVVGLYSGGVYLTPLAGGWIADRLIGRTAAVTAGALFMTAGHVLMAFEAPFLLALACLLVGVGLFKGNISSQVGALYAPGDLRRADAFQMFMTGISISAIVTPLVCGTLGQKVGWHWGFGAAGVGMVIGLAVYLSGRRWLPPEAPRLRGERRPRARLAPGEVGRIAGLVALLPALALAAVGNQQLFNAYIVWGDKHYALRAFGQDLPATWLISLDALISVAALVGVVAFWRAWTAWRGRDAEETTKLAIGAGIAALAPLCLAAAAAQEAASGQKAGLAWGLAFHIINSIGFANLFPVGLALYSRAAPRAVSGLMMGVYFLHIFAANLMVGWLGGLLETMAPTPFWLLHAAIVAVGAAILLVVKVALGRLLSPGVDAGAAQAIRSAARPLPAAARSG